VGRQTRGRSEDDIDILEYAPEMRHQADADALGVMLLQNRRFLSR